MTVPPSSPFALLGHHRSGTNFLTDVLQSHSRIQFVDEPLSMHTRAFPETDLLRWHAHEYEPGSLHPDLAAYPRSQEFFADLVSYLVGAPPGSVRGFKETLLFEKVSWLTAALPSLRIVHVVRDPRAVVASLLKHDVDRQWGYARRLADYFERHPDCGFEPRFATPLERCVSSWRIRLREFRRTAALLPTLTIRLEDVILDDRSTLTRVMSFLGVELETRQILLRRRSAELTRGGMYSTYRRADDVLGGWHRLLSDAEKDFVTRTCEEELHDLGYLGAGVRPAP